MPGENPYAMLRRYIRRPPCYPNGVRRRNRWDEMTKRLIIALAFLAAMSSRSALAFESSTSYSLLQLPSPAEGLPLQIRIGLISTTFSDCFAAVNFFDVRFLEAKKPVNKAEIEKYVENLYDALPEAEKDALKATLFVAKSADEELKAKMASPRLTDDEKLLYAKERERLLWNVWMYEAELLDEYAQTFKSTKYADAENELYFTDVEARLALSCLVDESCTGSEEEKSARLSRLEERKTSIALDVIYSPSEIQDVGKESILFMNKIAQSRIDFSRYLKNLYSQQGAKK